MVGRGSCSLASRYHNCHYSQHKGKASGDKKATPQGRSKGRVQRKPRLQKEREERVKGTEVSLSTFPSL